MLSWDERSDNKATSLVNKRWAHKPEGRGSSYFSMMTAATSLTALRACTHTHNNIYTRTQRGKHAHTYTMLTFYCTLSLCTVWWRQHWRSAKLETASSLQSWCVHTHTHTRAHTYTHTFSSQTWGGLPNRGSLMSIKCRGNQKRSISVHGWDTINNPVHLWSQGRSHTHSHTHTLIYTQLHVQTHIFWLG